MFTLLSLSNHESNDTFLKRLQTLHCELGLPEIQARPHPISLQNDFQSVISNDSYLCYQRQNNSSNDFVFSLHEDIKFDNNNDEETIIMLENNFILKKIHDELHENQIQSLQQMKTNYNKDSILANILIENAKLLLSHDNGGYGFMNACVKTSKENRIYGISPSIFNFVLK